jgi:hypothetical protein
MRRYREVQRELQRRGVGARPELRELLDACEPSDGVAQDAH